VVDKTALKSMKAAITKTIEIRNLMTHGTWSYDADHHKWAVTVTKGDWEDHKAPKTERKKKVNPEGRPDRAGKESACLSDATDRDMAAPARRPRPAC
jgi:hypothetical protein